ncbi:unnamed protein product [Ectocarpus sp. CCAP 1310/34]|nr:unnamed protein product [Ectocarpus sp. CCAP 1310/34]
MMHRLGQIITAAATAAAVATTTSAFVVAPAALRDGTRLSASLDSPRGWACNHETAAAYSSGCLRRSGACEGGGGRITMMMSGPPPGRGKFVKMGGTEDAQSFGPRCILASGLSLEERGAIRSILDDEDQDREDRTPFVAHTLEIAEKRVGDVLTDAPMIGLLQEKQEARDASPEPSSPVILISGFTNPELRDFVTRFRSETGVRAAFAKAVPNAMTKSVARLCGEIAQDHADALAGKLSSGKE